MSVDDAAARADRADITDVMIRYGTGIDSRDWDTFRSCFTDDFHGDYADIAEFDGLDAITEFMVGAHADMGHTLHRMSNVAVTLDGDSATARTYVDAVLMMPDGASGINAIGFYDDELVRTAQGWRISRRRYTGTYMTALGE